MAGHGDGAARAATTDASAPDSRYLPLLLSAAAVEASTAVALLLLIVRRRLARVGAVVLPPVALCALAVAATAVPPVRDPAPR